jgi:hypothetical protein
MADFALLGEALHKALQINKSFSEYGFRNLHDYRYDVRALTNCVLRNRVIYVRKSLPKASTLEWKTIY